MNNSINDAFINAVLAEASYVEGLLPGETDTLLAGDLAKELTVTLAQYVGQRFDRVYGVGVNCRQHSAIDC